MEYFIYKQRAFLVNTSSDNFDQRFRRDVLSVFRSVSTLSLNFPLGFLSHGRSPCEIKVYRDEFSFLRNTSEVSTFPTLKRYSEVFGIYLPAPNLCTILASNSEIMSLIESDYPVSFGILASRIESSLEEIPNRDLYW